MMHMKGQGEITAMCDFPFIGYPYIKHSLLLFLTVPISFCCFFLSTLTLIPPTSDYRLNVPPPYPTCLPAFSSVHSHETIKP